ncbi:MAG: phosphoserine phosphatase SerB [Wolinella sp.]
MKLAVFDFDSTLMDGETIDILARNHGVDEQVDAITKGAMEGGLDFYESLKRRVALLRGMELSLVESICANLPLMDGAKELIAELKKRGCTVVVFSGGFKNATKKAREILGFDADFSNILHHKDGKLTGEVGGEMMFGFSKGEMLQSIQRLLKISPEETMAVGDGANDASMFAHAKIRVAFCAKPILRKQANVIIDRKDLREILKHI